MQNKSSSLTEHVPFGPHGLLAQESENIKTFVKNINTSAMYMLYSKQFTDPNDSYPDSKVHVAIMGLTWGRQDLGGPRVGHMDLAICVRLNMAVTYEINIDISHRNYFTRGSMIIIEM